MLIANQDQKQIYRTSDSPFKPAAAIIGISIIVIILLSG
jgi:hypothetical protein